jgi:site-specific DNA-methyltransferase (adenine-specific)
MDYNEKDDCKIKKKRKKKYTPGLASLKFTPIDYWSLEEAQLLYENSSCQRNDQDIIFYNDCIGGMEKMGSNCVDLVIADPPFGLDFSGKETIYNRDQNLVVDSYKEINTNYGEFTKKWMLLLHKLMKPQATAYVFSGWNHLEEILREARACGLITINHLIWKYQFGVFTKKKYVTTHYHILLLAKNSNQYYFNKMEHYPLDVWEIKRRYKRGEHKNATTLPTELIKKCIEFSSKPGDLIFDPFMGMGTTAVVAKSLWRHFLGFEINEKMKPLIDKRLDNVFLGQDYLALDERLKKDSGYSAP